jgi:hypothetical protein
VTLAVTRRSVTQRQIALSNLTDSPLLALRVTLCARSAPLREPGIDDSVTFSAHKSSFDELVNAPVERAAVHAVLDTHDPDVALGEVAVLLRHVGVSAYSSEQPESRVGDSCIKNLQIYGHVAARLTVRLRR